MIPSRRRRRASAAPSPPSGSPATAPERAPARRLHESLQRRAALGQRLPGQRAALVGEQVEHDQLRRIFLRQLASAARRRVQPQLQGLEAMARDDDLAVDHEAARRSATPALRRSPGSSGRAVSGSWTAGRSGRRRGKRCSGSRRISARTASPRRSAGRRRARPPSASA